MLEKINRKAFFTLFASVTISGFIVICSLGRTLHQQKIDMKTAAAHAAKTPPAFTITETDGDLCVYKDDNPKPYMVLSFNTSLLSEYDREQLTEGITFKNETELKRFIEDLTS